MPSPLLHRALLAPALAALALGATATAGAASADDQRLVVRGDATAIDGPCDARGCRVDLGDGRFRGAPVGSGPIESASFTGLARFAVQAGTGRYAGARGSGVASLAEDAANQHRITLIGRLAVRR
ncbi:MAG: hypothetical protein ACAH82_08610 [Solirubrobacteraceae bacterium]